MRLESESVSRQYPAAPLSPLLHREAVEGVNRWLARFAPLLQPEGLDADRCRQWLQEIPTLREEGHQARETLEAQATQADLTLLTTLRQALRELDAQEAELRRRLGVLAPGDPEARVDLAQLQAQLAEAAARREVEEITGSSTTALGQRLEFEDFTAQLGRRWLYGPV